MAAPLLDIAAEPADGSALRFLRLAAPAPGEAERAKLVIRLRLENTSTTNAITVSGISVAFPGSRVATVEMFRPDLVLDDDGDGGRLEPGEAKFWSSGVVSVEDAEGEVVESAYNAIYLGLPAPTQARISVSALRFSDPAQLTIALAQYDCPEADDGYPLFLRQSDLPSAAMVTIKGRHWANGGGSGTQIYAYDVGVVRWVDGDWTRTRPGEGSGPSAYYAYGLPIRSVAAGTVHSIVDGIDEGPDFGAGNHGGNRITIAHANGERSYFAHLQNGSFRVAEGDSVNAGTVLGLLGFTGNTGAPHTHIEIRRHSDGALRPYAFRDVWIKEVEADTPFEPKTGWVEMPQGRGIPDGSYHLWASAKRPAWYPPDWAEVFKFGVSDSGYQDMFDRVTYAGYRPDVVDVYEHDGKRFFNAIFRPREVAWRAQHHMDFDEYQEAYNTNKADGYRLHNITSYPRGGGVNYAAIWLKRSGPSQRAYHGRSLDNHEEQVERNTQDGYHPVNVSVAAPNGVRSYAALWAKSDVGGWRSKSALTPDAYQELWNEQRGELHRHATYLSAWQLMPNGPAVLSAVFQETAPGSGSTVGRHGMSSAELQAEFDKRIDAGYLTRAIAGYSEGGKARFAALWRRA